MKSYSVAIRTLGTNPAMLKTELESIFSQTVAPEHVIVYIAEGYQAPDFRVGTEKYVYVKKGMLTQRALDYKEIGSELILLLDDDVYLPPHSVESLIDTLIDGDYDCVAPDTFANHKLSAVKKIYSFFTNLSLPLIFSKYAFKIHGNGTLSYINNPTKSVYPTQSASGPCSLWRLSAFRAIDMKSERWLDTLSFAYGEDQLTHYKLYVNGGKLAMHFDTGIEHRDGKASRAGAYRSADIFITRAQAQYIIWHRSLYKSEKSGLKRFTRAIAFSFKLIWLLPVHVIAALGYRDIKVPVNFIKGTVQGIKFTHSDIYKNLPPYKNDDYKVRN